MREYADGEVVQHEHRTSVMTLMYGSWLKCDPGTVHVAAGVDEKAIHTERTRLIVCCNVSSLWTRFQKACHSIRESTACEIEVDSADSNDGDSSTKLHSNKTASPRTKHETTKFNEP